VFLDHHHENNPASVPTGNPADTPTINAIANRDLSEEPQKLGLNLHGDPCMASRLDSQARAAAIPLPECSFPESRRVDRTTARASKS
jgi:hypothetical protein